jgi:glucokinase
MRDSALASPLPFPARMTPRRTASGKGHGAIIGMDLGGTSLSAGLVTHGGEVLHVVERATHEHGPGTAVEQMLEVVARVHGEARSRGIAVDGVGVGLPGIADVEKGRMIGDVMLIPEVTKVPVAERIREVTGLPAFLDNDVNALALAESRYGSGHGVRSLVLLAIGSGPGGALVVDGELFRGHGGFAGEFGHVPLGMDGPPCACGGHGCASLYLSGAVLARRASVAVADGGSPTLLGLAGGDPSAITARTIFDAARAGDSLAAGMVDRACEALAALLGIIINGLNPELIVVTGGMLESLTRLEADILRRAGRYAFARAIAATTIRFAPSAKRDTVRGGAALFLYESERRRRALGGTPARPRRRG